MKRVLDTASVTNVNEMMSALQDLMSSHPNRNKAKHILDTTYVTLNSDSTLTQFAST
jgi:hypothetical protein